MKPTSPALRKILESRQWFQVDVYTFSGGNLGSNVLRYCGGDQDLTYNGALYPCGGSTGPYFDRQDNKAKVHQKVGTAVDTLQFDVIPGAAQILGAPFLSAVHSGVFDGSELIFERLFMPTYGDTRAGAVRLFVGRVVEIDASRTIATFMVNSHLELLNLQMPRNLYQPGCLNTLGDAQCGVDLSGSPTGTIGGGSGTSDMNLNITTTGMPDGNYNLGKIRFTSGALAGQQRMIKASVYNSSSSASITVIAPFSTAPAAGDTFVISPGCDKSWAGANGCPKFSNTARYRGFPFIPQPTTAV
jgi:uncharacterized phage protein (TIGR02218 family)